MKKVKSIFSAVAVLAIVGGALAFKAHAFKAQSPTAVYYTCAENNVCDEFHSVHGVSLTYSGGGNPFVTNASLDSGGACSVYCVHSIFENIE